MSHSSLPSRRSFLGAAAALASGAVFPRVLSARASRHLLGGPPVFGDYKAMVCVYLYGGTDSHNMIVPIGADPDRGHAAYGAARPDLTVADAVVSKPDLRTGPLGTGSGNPYYSNGSASEAYLKGVYPLPPQPGIEYGVNSIMPELAQLFSDRRASVVLNAGTLVKPTTRADILAGQAELPSFLYAHDHQQRQLQTGRAGDLSGIGWAGRIADSWKGVNSSNIVGLNVSYSGNDAMMVGSLTSPTVLTVPDPSKFEGMSGSGSAEEQDRAALFRALAGEQAQGVNVQFDGRRTASPKDPFTRIMGEAERSALEVFEFVGDAWDANPIQYASTGSYGEPLFDVPNPGMMGIDYPLRGSLIRQLEAVAKMIHLGATGALGSGYERQVFFVSLGGFDNHLGQAIFHPSNIREVSLALWKFQMALEELGHAEKVTTMTMSDFGRTLTQNWDGTDHAWGGHSILMGGLGTQASGQLRGGEFFGTAPSLVLGGVDDAEEQGRLIPTTSQDQITGAICNWFGVDEATVGSIFTNLENFQTGGSLSSAYLDLFA